jgi:capsular exopolysaccharide synthesis family protein
MDQNLEQLEAEAFQVQGHFNLLAIAWRHKSLVALGLVVGLVLGTLSYARRSPVYRSDAQILVVKKRPDVLPALGGDTSYSYYEDYLATHQVLIKSPLIAGRSVKKPGIAGLESLVGATDPASLIIGSLVVSRDAAKDASGMASSNILGLSLRWTVPDDSAIILGAVIDSYKDFLDETYRNVNEDTLQLITKARDVLKKDIAQKEKEYRDFRQQSPLLWKGKDGLSLAQERLDSLESKRSNLFLRRTELQGRLAALEKALKDGQNHWTLAAILPPLPSNGAADGPKRASLVSLEEQLLPLLLQEQTLLEDYGPNHPQVQGVRKRIELTRNLFAQPGASVVARTGDSAATGNGDPATIGSGASGVVGKGSLGVGDHVVLYVQALKQELSDIEMAEQLLTERVKEEYQEAKRVASYEFTEETYRNDIARSQQLYDSIIKRLQELNFVKDYGGYDARVITPPSAGVKVGPRAMPIVTVAAFLGILGGFGLAYLAERTDKSFRSPEEIHRHLGIPVVGHVPVIAATPTAGHDDTSSQPVMAPILCAYHQPRSTEAEAYRGVRTALYFSAQGKEYKTIQITSPNMGDGKTVTAANLGISIAQSGRRTILIDADLRRPRLHELFGLSAQVGLASVIRGEAELEEAIQQSAVPGLSLLACGPVPSNPAELLTSARFPELLERIRDQYDFVLVDSPPLLAVSDPAVVAPRVEAVLLSIRYSKNGRPNAQRAKEILNTLGVVVLGVIVNAVDLRAVGGRYGYDHLRYGYGHGYGYMDGAANNGNIDNGTDRDADETSFESPSQGTSAALVQNGSDHLAASNRKGRGHRSRKGLAGVRPQSFLNWLRGQR